VDITYDLADPDSTSADGDLAVSTNGGASYTLPATSFTGAVGSGVRGGVKRPHLERGGGLDGRYSANVRFRVTADDAATPAGMAAHPAGSLTMGDTFSEAIQDDGLRTP